ncbi:MAG: aldo/keto reductase [Armatimonadota bacterium]|nr:aldo/keto reductase [Armatimonadota bacterium]
MRFFHLPNVAKALSVVCLGTGSFGSAYTQDESFALLDAFAERGGSFVDTAHVYADWAPGGAGASERTVGRWLHSRGMADRIAIGTKGGHPRLETMSRSRLRPEEIARDLSESLERLQLDAVDLYWLHRDDPAVAVGEILTALNNQLRAGRIRALGASNWSTGRLTEAADFAARHGLTGFCASQIAWSLAQDRTAFDTAQGTISMDAAVLGYYCASGVKVIPYSAQAGGFFARPYDALASRDARYHSPLNARRWDRVQTLAHARGCSANAMALAYLLNHPCGGVGIVGPHTLAQVADSCGASEIILTAEDLMFLEGETHQGQGA